jgi:hypothetical protein
VEEWDLPIKLSFATGPQGDIESMSGAFEPAVPSIVFRRVPSRHLKEKGYLERFAGAYSLMDMPMLIVLKGDHALLAALPGQPDIELEPVKESEFRLKGVIGSRIEFTSDASGVVTEALLTQPWGVLSATRRAAS